MTLALVGVAAAFISATSALGAQAGITLNRAPAPPQAVKAGSGVVTIGYEIVYDSRGLRIVTRIKNLAEQVLTTIETRQLNDANAVPGRRITGNLSWAVPANLPAGTYVVATQFFSTSNSAVAEATAENSFEVAAELGDIRATAFDDSNGNGIRDTGEPGLTGWTFEITSPGGGLSSFPTIAGGSVSIPSIPIGTWGIAETVESGWTTTTPPSGTIAVPANGTAAFEVGQIRPGTISGTVFDDANRNGTRQNGELGIGGATVTLTGTDGKGNAVAPIAKPSNSDGTYSFAGLLPGTYTVTMTPLAGKVATNSPVQVGVVIASNGSRDKVDFGLAASGNLSVTSFEDTNGNGVRDPGEPGIDCPFSLVGPNGAPDALSTGAAGTSARPDSVAGDWQVGQQCAGGFVPTTPASGTVSVPPGATGSFIVGNVRPATITGLVWVDTNRNGVRDSGEAINPGVTITLTGTDGRGRAVALETITAASGVYVFTGLQPGTHRVSVKTPSGVELTTPGTVSDIVLGSNGKREKVDFGVATPVPPTTPTTATTPLKATASAADPGSLRVIKTGPATAKGGATFTYSITVKSVGKVIVKNVVLTDAVPNLVTLVGVPRGASVVNGVVTWLLGDLAPGASRKVKVRVRLAAGAPFGKYSNTASAGGDNARPARATTSLQVREPSKRIRRTGGVTG